jgi:hypothetical protein
MYEKMLFRLNISYSKGMKNIATRTTFQEASFAINISQKTLKLCEIDWVQLIAPPMKELSRASRTD